MVEAEAWGLLLDAAQANGQARTLASLVKATRECMPLNSTGWRKLEISQKGILSCLQQKPTCKVYATLKKILRRMLQDIVQELKHQQSGCILECDILLRRILKQPESGLGSVFLGNPGRGQ